jgi:transcription factor E2F7/8
MQPPINSVGQKIISSFFFCSFLRLFSNEQETWGGVCLDSAAKKLHVERRRIYDIVNVLESVEIVARRAKNKYAWFGMTRLPQAIERLRNATTAELNQEPAERQAAEAILSSRSADSSSIISVSSMKTEAGAALISADSKNCTADGVNQMVNADDCSAVHPVPVDSSDLAKTSLEPVDGRKQDCIVDFETASDGSKNVNVSSGAFEQPDPNVSNRLGKTDAGSTEDDDESRESLKHSTGVPCGVAAHDQQDAYSQFLEMYRMAKASRREKSLGVLSQKFVQLFLNSEHGVVSLEPAARKLLEEDTYNDEGQLKTKIRRLYDIANILCSLNLVMYIYKYILLICMNFF